jgi:cellulose synthase operon protein C
VGYAQQPYVPQPPAGYAQQPYVPQPPAGYAQQPYYPAAPAPQPSSSGGAPGNNVAAGNVSATQTLGVAQELAQINREQASTITGGVDFRNRAGEDGLSELTDIEAPLQGRIAAGNGHIVVTATPATLDASSAGTGNISTLSRFGAGTSLVNLANAKAADVQAFASQNNFGSQTANGVGLSLGYESQALSGDVGVTPLGFPQQNVVGGLQYNGSATDKVSYSLAVARRAVTDSLLSYAGARDQGNNLEWGGVVSNGALASLGWDDGTSGLYLNGAFQYLTGDNVPNNDAEKGGGGVYTRVYSDAGQILTVGLNTTLMHYDKNLSYFTYGQGGYFSPQQYVILNLPVEWTGRTGAFTFDLKGSIGVQHFREDPSNYFPTNGNMQNQAAINANAINLVSTTQVDPNAVYPGLSKTGVAYSFKAVGEYQLAPQLAVGAVASLGNAYEYREWLAAVYVRYSFTKQEGIQPFPPTPTISPYLTLSN